MQLKHAKDHLDVLRREVDSAQQAYDAGLQRASQIHLESQLDQSNIAILNAAVPPLFPAKPKILLNALISIVVGMILDRPLSSVWSVAIKGFAPGMC